MRILCPPGELVVDGSLWNHHLLPQELLAGGIRWVVIGLYKQWDPAIGKYVLNTNSKRLCDQAIAGGLGLMTYYYYHPQDNPVAEADWYIDMQTRSGYPVPFTWADCESFNYTMDPHVRSENNRLFCTQLRKRFPAMGLYTPKWYIDQWAPQMGTWVGDFSYAWVSHYGRQPKVATSMTWDILKNSWTPNYDIEVAPSQANKTVGHQFTGDVCILPGLYSELNARMTTDVSVFAKEFIASLGGSPMRVGSIALLGSHNCLQDWRRYSRAL